MNADWRTTSTAPEGAVVMTKIDDENGARNECALRRRGNLWWMPDDEMYVYYRPTHYRPLTKAEDAEWRSRIRNRAANLAAKADAG